MVHSTLVTRQAGISDLVPCLPVQSAREMLAAVDQTTFRRLLLPFDGRTLANSDLETALTMSSQAKVILLHVGHDVNLDEEALFTVLRGLQAQTQQEGVLVDNLVTDTAVSLLDYAHSHNIDLILLPDKQVES